MRRCGFIWILWCALAGAAGAQQGTDFSGRWVLVSSAAADPASARFLNVSQPVMRTNQLGGAMPPAFLTLIIEREFSDRVTTETHKIGVQGGLVGGTVAGGSSGPRFQSGFSVGWDGPRLVIERHSYSGPTRDAGPYWEHVEEWELDPAGMLVVAVADRASDTEPKSNTFTYRRD
jgi:hypothetical protein